MRKDTKKKKFLGKSSHSEMPARQKVLTANSPPPKSHQSKMFLRQSVPTAKSPYGAKSHDETSHGELSYGVKVQSRLETEVNIF